VASPSGPSPNATTTWPDSPGTTHAWPGLAANPWVARNPASSPAGTSPASSRSENTPTPVASIAPPSGRSAVLVSSMAIDMRPRLRGAGAGARGVVAADVPGQEVLALDPPGLDPQE
jgi:hypothetical protein